MLDVNTLISTHILYIIIKSIVCLIVSLYYFVIFTIYIIPVTNPNTVVSRSMLGFKHNKTIQVRLINDVGSESTKNNQTETT